MRVPVERRSGPIREDVAVCVERWDKKAHKEARNFLGALDAIPGVVGDDTVLAIETSAVFDAETESYPAWGMLVLTAHELVLVGRGTQIRHSLANIDHLNTFSGRDFLSSMRRGGMIQVRSRSGETIFELVAPGSMGRIFPQLQEGIARAKDNAAKAPRAAPVATGIADELAKLADLRAQGVLTDEEFAAQKARLLGG